jgi:hypothetical protein
MRTITLIQITATLVGFVGTLVLGSGCGDSVEPVETECEQASDCAQPDDARTCTVAACVDGACIASIAEDGYECFAMPEGCRHGVCTGGECIAQIQPAYDGQACEVGGVVGVCDSGNCVSTAPSSVVTTRPCAEDWECYVDTCSEATCAKSFCAYTKRPNGDTCSGMSPFGPYFGTCFEGLCSNASITIPAAGSAK